MGAKNTTTPGPWTVHVEPPTGIDSFDLGGFRIDADSQEQVAYVWNASQRCQTPGYIGPPHYFGSHNGMADARLIAAAPALLAALEEAATHLDQAAYSLAQAGKIDQARAAEIDAQHARAALRLARGA